MELAPQPSWGAAAHVARFSLISLLDGPYGVVGTAVAFGETVTDR